MTDPIVETSTGKVRGITVDGVHVFKGIPYGGSTAGANRFQPAEPPAPWTGVRDAVAYGPTAPQLQPAETGGSSPADPAAAARMAPFMEFLHGLAGDEPAQDEDCLVLNVWTSSTDQQRNRAVMVWLHGGAFSTGSGSWPMYDGSSLASRGDAVVVTINHRLGPLGFLQLADLGDERYADSGNAGMLDIVLALRWVQENIANFGGDAGRVLVFGDSGGASKSSLLLGMPAAKGLIHRAAIMSGPLIRACPQDAATANTEKLLSRLGLTVKDLPKLHELPYRQLIEEAEHIGIAINAGLVGAAGAEQFMPFQAVVDGRNLPGHPMDPVASPYGADVPVMVGSTKDDMKMIMLGMPWFGTLDDAGLQAMADGMFGALAGDMLAAYRRDTPTATPTELACAFVTDRVMWWGAVDWAQRKVMAGGAPAYVYRFDFETPALGGVLGATHGGDIPFAFDNYFLTPMAGDRPENAQVGRVVSDTFVRFAQEGDPNNGSIPKWQPYSLDERATMVFDVEPHGEDDPRAEIRELYSRLSP
ncbi:MAG: putative carboxylesterase, type [Pseudonocardiales bacterium]|nr:putative carboxylesterase, type [Pseudonocardiales bacterium]